ncbi:MULTISPECIES: hypothetical protein [Streptomyces]|uniref:hypothetical protein n=1 Tax=Streptomyces TaxID=1883 RepID=UPI00345BDCBF
MTITLPQAMGNLLPTDSPPQWRAAVDRAAQLLAPNWPTDPVEEAPLGGLDSLALILYALHYTQRLQLAEIPVGALREVLDGELDANDEPYTIKKLIVDGLGAADHQIHDADHVMCRVAARLLRRDAPPVVTDLNGLLGGMEIPFGMGGATPGPSELRFAAAWLKHVLSALGEEAVATLPPAPKPACPANVVSAIS